MTEVLTAPAPLAPEPAPAPLTVRRVGTETLIALAVGLVAAIAVTWPLVTKLGHIGHDPFDPRFQAWTIDWVQHKLGSPGSLFDANIFAPEPHTLAYSDSLLGIAIPLLPLRWLGVSPIGQLNIALLLGMATSAAAGYLFGRVVTRSITVGALTAAAFAFGPFGSVSSGALHATAHAGVGVAAAAAWWLADRAESPARRSLLAPAALMAAAIVWQASVSFYPGAYAFGAALVVLAVRWRALGRRGWSWALGAMAVAGLCTLVMAVPYLQVRDEQPGFRRSLADLPALSADFGSTDPRLSLWGSLLGKGSGWPIYGEPAFPGIVLLVLAPVGLVSAWLARGRERLAAIAGAALGARGRRARHRCGSDGLAPLRARTGSSSSTCRDGRRCGRREGRGWSGSSAWACSPASVRVPWPARSCARRTAACASSAAAVATVAVIGVLVEGYAPWTGRPDIRVSAVDEKLAELTTPGGVLYLPALESGSAAAAALTGFRQAENVYGTTAHHRRTPNGYSGFFPPSWVALVGGHAIAPRRRCTPTPPRPGRPLRRGARLGPGRQLGQAPRPRARRAPCGSSAATVAISSTRSRRRSDAPTKMQRRRGRRPGRRSGIDQSS